MNDAATWGTFEEAVQAFESGRFSGIGFVFTKDDPFIGIDLDACRDPKTGKLTDWAAAIVANFKSYTEASVSGYGLHIVVRGILPTVKSKRTKKLKGVETFGDKQPEIMLCQSGGYFVITGDVQQARTRVRRCTKTLKQFFQENFSQKKTLAKKRRSTTKAVPVDKAVLESLLDEYDASDDRSGADFRLCCHAIRSSWSPDDVWERVCDESKFAERGRDYFEMTWDKAANEVESADVFEASDDPHRLAGEIQRELPHLRFWRGDWWTYEKQAYVELSDDDVKAKATSVAKIALNQAHAASEGILSEGAKQKRPVKKVSRSLIENVLQALKSECHVDSRFEQPAWLIPEAPFPAEECLATRSEIIHVPSGKRMPTTPDLFTSNVVDYAFDRKAKCPNWRRFLTELWPEDSEAIRALQELFGYLLLPDTRQQKIFVLIGPKRSGKGTIARVLRELLGSENVVSPMLKSLQGQFGMMPLLNKTAAIISESRLSGRSDIPSITERLLSISGEDAQTIDRKHKPAVTTQLNVRFLIISNEVPWLTDASATLPSRMIPLRLTRSWYGEEDKQLTAKLLLELPGILNWAIEGYRRLHKRGHFAMPKSSEQIVRQMEELASPVLAFTRERCEIGAEFRVPKQTLYDAWSDWCRERDLKPGNNAVFGRNLRSAIPELTDTQPRVSGGRKWCYRGIRIRGRGTSGTSNQRFLDKVRKKKRRIVKRKKKLD